MSQISFNSTERVLIALQHKEPDRIPLDFGGTTVTGISIEAYESLCDFLGLNEEKVEIFDRRAMLAQPNEEIMKLLKSDVRGLIPRSYSNIQLTERKKHLFFMDEWGVNWRMSKEKGYYYEPVGHPLAGDIERADIDKHKWPDPLAHIDFDSLYAISNIFSKQKKAIIMNHWIWGIFETAAFLLRGIEDFYRDLVKKPEMACYLMDKVVETKKAFWKEALKILGDRIDVIKQNEDLGTQNSLLISPKMYRKYIKPRQKKLFNFIKNKGDIYIMLHSDGAIRDLIPDFIEIGVDILNPVQYSAKGMDSVELKREFGKDICFWGGGIDTQQTLPNGSPQEIKEKVRKNIEALAPGGGFVFSTIHNIQGDVPPRNVMAMFEAFAQYSQY